MLATRITRSQIQSTERLARQDFLSGRQADTYVAVCDQVSRAAAWANVAWDKAQDRTSELDPVALLTGDRWFQLQGQLRVFGSQTVRDEFDSLISAARRLRALETAARQGRPAETSDVDRALRAIRLHGANLRTAVHRPVSLDVA